MSGAPVSKKAKMQEEQLQKGYFFKGGEEVVVTRGKDQQDLFLRLPDNKKSLYLLLKNNLASVYCTDFEDLAMYGYNRYTQPSDIVLLEDMEQRQRVYMCLVKDESKTSWNRTKLRPIMPMWKEQWDGVLSTPFAMGGLEDTQVVLSPEEKDQETIVQYLRSDSQRALYYHLKEYYSDKKSTILWSEARMLKPDNIQSYSSKQGVHLSLGCDGKAYIGLHMWR